MTSEPKLPPFPDVPSRFSGMDAAEVHAYGLQCFEAGRQQGVAQADALHGLAASSREIEAGTAHAVAMVWKDWSGLHFSASGKTTDKEVELVNKVCTTIGMPAGYFDVLVGVWRGDDKNCHEIPLLRAIVTAYCMGAQSAPPVQQTVALTEETRYALIEEHLGLQKYPQRGACVIDNRTGRWCDAQRYFDLIDAAIAATEKGKG